MIRFSCPQCQAVLQCSGNPGGTTFLCPRCQQHIQLPSSKQTQLVTSSLPRPSVPLPPMVSSRTIADEPEVAPTPRRSVLPWLGLLAFLLLFVGAAGVTVFTIVRLQPAGLVIAENRASPAAPPTVPSPALASPEKKEQPPPQEKEEPPPKPTNVSRKDRDLPDEDQPRPSSPVTLPPGFGPKFAPPKPTSLTGKWHVAGRLPDGGYLEWTLTLNKDGTYSSLVKETPRTTRGNDVLASKQEYGGTYKVGMQSMVFTPKDEEEQVCEYRLQEERLTITMSHPMYGKVRLDFIRLPE